VLLSASVGTSSILQHSIIMKVNLTTHTLYWLLIKVTINEITINNLPHFAPPGSNQGSVGVEVYEKSKLILSTIPKRISSSAVIPIKIVKNLSTVFFTPLEPLRVERDVQIRFFRHLKTDSENQILTISSFTFHTGFISTGMIRVAIDDLEVSRRDASGIETVFPPTFSVDLNVGSLTRTRPEQALSYSRALDPSILRCCKTLAGYLAVRADDILAVQLERQGFPKPMGFLN
jgi:C2 domain of PTEN tumour-suppressor protein